MKWCILIEYAEGTCLVDEIPICEDGQEILSIKRKIMNRIDIEMMDYDEDFRSEISNICGNIVDRLHSYNLNANLPLSITNLMLIMKESASGECVSFVIDMCLEAIKGWYVFMV